jgi:Xaa-Pro aminopeptidase
MWYVIPNTENSGQPATRYFCGFAGTTSVLIFESSMREGYLLIDSRYWDWVNQRDNNSCKMAKINVVNISRNYPLAKAINDIKIKHSIGHITIDEAVTSYSSYKKLLTLGFVIESQVDVFEKMRSVKNGMEIAKINKAIEISKRAFSSVRDMIVPGVREIDISAKLSYQMKIFGAEKDAFDIIVTSGIRSAIPHAQTSNAMIRAEDSVIVDYGCVYDGYTCDFTETILMPQSSDILRKIFALVTRVHKSAVEQVKIGTKLSTIDSCARDAFRQVGYGDNFLHAIGHGVGMGIHEYPHFTPDSSETLELGNVVAIEPGIYVSGVGGVRIETTEIVKKN